MSPELFLSLAGNVVAVIGILVLLDERSLARELAADRADEIAELKADVRGFERALSTANTELIDHRAAKAKRIANLNRGSAKSSQTAAH